MNIVVCLGTHESRLYAVKYTHTMLTETLLFSVIQIQFQSGSDKARHALFQQMLSRWSNFSTVLILGPSFGRFVSYDLENSQLFKHWNFEKKFEKKIRKNPTFVLIFLLSRLISMITSSRITNVQIPSLLKTIKICEFTNYFNDVSLCFLFSFEIEQ